MLSEAVKKYSATAPPTVPARPVQQPLQTRPSVNTLKSSRSTKRNFQRTMSTTSSLGALHESTSFFNENDFDDDAAIDLTVNGPSVQYPSIAAATADISYPTLPPLPANLPQQHTSSEPIPWSTSPPEHFVSPPRKRRAVPWTSGQDRENSITSLPSKQRDSSRYPWNMTAPMMQAELKELRKASKPRSVGTTQGDAAAGARTSTSTALPKIFLSEEQKGVLTAVVDEGKSVFFTGSAGTGKSVLMRSIIQKLRQKHTKNPERVAVTASTGLAAVNIDGTTLHSFAGIGLGKDTAPELVKKIRRNAKCRQRWAQVRVLIVDEVSMIDGELFDKLEHIARILRNNGKPFGGIQLVVTGDFFQLPPVPEKDRAAKFSFDAATWDTCIEHTILLNHVFRQKDARFAGMLNEMRLGRLTPASIKAFQTLSRPLNFTDDLEATEL